MTATTMIEMIRSQVRALREKGGTTISADSLEDFLNHLASGQVDKEIGLIIASKKEAALAKYQARVSILVEGFKSVIQTGQTALKSLFLVNGGSAVAVLALVGHLSTSPNTAAYVHKFGEPLLCFATGLALAVIGSGLTYLAQRAYSSFPSKRKCADGWNTVVIVVCIFSLLAFCGGCFEAYTKIQGIAVNKMETEGNRKSATTSEPESSAQTSETPQ